MDLGLDVFHSGDGVLPPAEAFPEMTHPSTEPQGIHKSSSPVPEEEESSESAEAPLRRRKAKVPRVIPADRTTELRNSDLAQWNKEYTKNMAEVQESKTHHKAPAQARKNAAAWVYGSGIGGVGNGLGASKLKSPLDMFAGDSLLEALTGVRASTLGKKRTRSDEDDRETGSEERRVRAREDDGDQVGRGNEMVIDDEDLQPLIDDTVSNRSNIKLCD